MSSLNIVTSSNNNYFNYLASLISSLLTNSSQNFINFYVLYEDLSQENINKIINKFNSEKFKIEFIKIEKNLFKNAILETYSKSSFEAYSRLLIPEIFSNLDKIIYLDADTIVLENLNNLNTINIEGYEISAVQDFNESTINIFKKTFNLEKVTSYFNSGVLIMNLDKLRREKFTQKSLKLIEDAKYNYKFFDQDILNYFFSESYLKLDPRWNVQLYLELATNNYKHSTLSKEQYSNCVNNPYIIHFTIVKPDKFNYFFKYQEIYKYYLQKTGFKFKYKKTTIKEIVWTISEIIFFRIINIFNLRVRNKILNFLRIFIK